MRPLRALLVLVGALGLVAAVAGCTSTDLPDESPPLADMDEPLALHEEPRDEEARVALALGGWTGLYVTDARRTLGEMDDDGAPHGVRVQRVVENSPGDAAGIEEGDLLLEAVDGAGTRHELAWPSQWRELELAARPGATLRVLTDRAGVERVIEVVVAPRVRPAERTDAQRFREEQRVGLVVRTATEVEARGAGLGPGGGAVIVGLSAASPWREAGLRYGDLLVSVDGEAVAHPQVVLDRIRDADEEASLRVEFARDGQRQSVEAPVSERASELRRAAVPLVFSYERERGETELSVLGGLVRHRTTDAAWEWRLLWVLTLSGGDADRLVEAGK